jgi:hypothetical protein
MDDDWILVSDGLPDLGMAVFVKNAEGKKGIAVRTWTSEFDHVRGFPNDMAQVWGTETGTTARDIVEWRRMPEFMYGQD